LYTRVRKAVLLIFLAALPGSACQRQEGFSPNKAKSDGFVDQESFEGVVISSTRGKVASVTRYGRMERHSRQRLVRFFDGVDLNLFDDGVHTSHIVADSATLKEKYNEIEFGGNVRAYSDNGISLRTSRLLWNADRDTVTSDTFVTVITVARDTLYGLGFGSSKEFQNWVIRQPSGVTDQRLNLDVVDEKKE